MAQRTGKPPAKYRQIAADLRARIEAGEYPIGAQLPTRPEMADEYSAAQGTVENALDALRQLGLVETRHGSGTFVLRRHPGESEAQQLGEQVAALRERVAELEKRAGDAQELREDISRLESNLMELYGKTAFDYPHEHEPDGQQQKRRTAHG